ncbi:MAG: hypothetical protein KC776_13120 [Myxococcales bacterium]|nr:hypothetical protein [Myxococcales bacterium]MCB9583516.1 hypothetical protein [Polyangiaceae bacterium]
MKPSDKKPGLGPTTFRINRRDFMKLSGIGVGAALSPGLVGCATEVGPTLKSGSLGRVFAISAKRPQDFLELRFEFIGLKLDTAKENLVKNGDGPFAIIVHFPSQHIQEETIFEEQPLPAYYPPVVQTVLSGPSRVVFTVPENFTPIPYNLDGLLTALKDLRLSVAATALPKDPNAAPLGDGSGLVLTSQQQSQQLSTSTQLSLSRMGTSSGVSVGYAAAGSEPSISVNPGPPVAPEHTETAIELPYRLILSPNSHSGFTHAGSPVQSGNRVELWHSRLAVFDGGSLHEGSSYYRTLRAIWTRDNDNHANNPSNITFDEALDFGTRQHLVNQQANYTALIKPRPVDAKQLMLTSLGGYLDVRGEWEDDQLVSLWEHKTALGRDNFVKVAYNGYLYPCGHRATLVVITERKLKHPDQPHTAYLYKRCYIVCKEPIRHYPGECRDIPFEFLHVRQLVTPPLDECRVFDKPKQGETLPTPLPLLVKVDGKPYRFPVEVLDRNEHRHFFGMPMMWIPLDSGTGYAIEADGSNWNAAHIYANEKYGGESFNTVDIKGQRFGYAPEEEVDDTVFETRSMTFKAVSDGSNGHKPGFGPGLVQATVQVEAVRSLGGAGGLADVVYAAPYLSQAFTGSNAQGQVLLEATPPVDLSFSGNSKNSGGFIQPGIKITGLSRTKGPIGGDVNAFAAGQFNASSFFDQIDAYLFGCVSLKDIVASTGLEGAPTFATQALDVVGSVVRDAKQLVQLAGVLPISPPPVLTTIASGADAFTSINPSQLTPFFDDVDTLSLGGSTDGDVRLLKRVTADFQRTITDPGFNAALQAFKNAQELAKNQTVRLEWRPELKGDPFGFFEPHQPMRLSVEARAKDLPGKPAGVDLIAAIPDFNLNLLGNQATFMVLEFDRLQFRVVNGKKPEIDVIFKNIAFDGVLAFVRKLSEIIPLEGFSDPPNVDVTEEGLKAMFTLPLPNLAVGMFSLENMALSAGFHIPFFGPPMTVNFGFCSRESPFRLTVAMLGGGGFFGLTCSPNGMELLEASLEFGASLSVDFGVASGSISIMAGIYFAMGPKTAELTGYLRARGEVDVLGLISASIELYMELKYEFSSHKVTGKASIEIEVSVLCFSGTVKIKAERKFAGDNEDPTLAELMAPIGNYHPFTEYLNAFAA